MLAQIADFNYTQIPNYFLDEVYHSLSGCEVKVMLYIYRHTLGYHKLVDRLSYDNFLNGITKRDGTVLDRGCGISRRSLVNALASLVKRGLIKRFEDKIGNYWIELIVRQETTVKSDCEQSTQEASLSTQDDTQVQILQNEATSRVQKVSTQKKNLKPKENKDRASIQQILEIKGITKSQATKLVNIAKRNRPNSYEDYLNRLVFYVTSNGAIRNPAAAITVLIRDNQDRTVSKGDNYPNRNNKPSNRAYNGYSGKQSSKPIDFEKYTTGKYAFLFQGQ